MSALFQLSMWIRVCAQISTLFPYLGYSAICEMTPLFFLFQHCHGYLTESVGIPVWGSYAIFALATLFSGLILGLVSEPLEAEWLVSAVLCLCFNPVFLWFQMMVFLADCLCPSKKHRPPQYPYSSKPIVYFKFNLG